jgi:RNAse (barnase) inhibitor barstar
MKTKMTISNATQEQRKVIRQVTQFMAHELFPNHHIYIEYKLKSLDAYGYCIYTHSNIKPRHFTIELEKNMNKKLLTETIIHELIHVNQMAREILKDRFGINEKEQFIELKKIWKNKDYTNTPYSRQPWERQAYRMEKKLMKKWSVMK